MSDWHFGDDYDMWLYPPVDWTDSDYDYELPEPIEAADIEGTLLVNAEDAIGQVCRLQAENAKLREQTELLVTLLRNDCDIEASWDGLRKFWYIGLTESGCLMRDRACKAEAENAKLRERIAELEELLPDSGRWFSADTVEAYVAENAKLRELVRDYERCSMHADCDLCEYDGVTSTHCPLSPCFPDIDELRELGVEVDR